MNNITAAFSKQDPARLLRTALAATVAGAFAVFAFFTWFDTQLALWNALDTMERVADTMERDGRLREAEQMLRDMALIKEHQKVGPLFPGAFLPPEYGLQARADVARIVMQDNRLVEARELYLGLVTDAAARLGPDHPYSRSLARDYAECLQRIARAAKPARE